MPSNKVLEVFLIREFFFWLGLTSPNAKGKNFVYNIDLANLLT